MNGWPSRQTSRRSASPTMPSVSWAIWSSCKLPAVGSSLAKGAAAGVVESVKAASDIYAPLTGRVVEVNPATVETPGLVNSDPMGAGWLFKIEVGDPSEVKELLDE